MTTPNAKLFLERLDGEIREMRAKLEQMRMERARLDSRMKSLQLEQRGLVRARELWTKSSPQKTPEGELIAEIGALSPPSVDSMEHAVTSPPSRPQPTPFERMQAVEELAAGLSHRDFKSGAMRDLLSERFGVEINRNQLFSTLRDSPLIKGTDKRGWWRYTGPKVPTAEDRFFDELTTLNLSTKEDSE